MNEQQGGPQPVSPEVVQQPPEQQALDLGLALALPKQMLERALASSTTDMQKFDAKVALLTKLQPQAIKMTKPQDWVKMGDKVYLQATGAERLAPLYGLVFGFKTFEREDFADGTFAYHASMAVFSQTTGILMGSVEGGRHSGEEFFARYDTPKPFKFPNKDDETAWKAEHRLDPLPLNVRKAAATNCEIRAVSKIAGLRNLTVEDIAAQGIDKNKIRGFTYDKGAKGGKAKQQDDSGRVCIPDGFGSGGGRAIADLEDEELLWYLKAVGNSVTDPAKTRYKPQNEALVDAIQQEIDKRSRGDEAKPE